MPLRKIKKAIDKARKANARTMHTVDAALVDAHRARSTIRDAGVNKAIQKDRRAALSEYHTVRHVLIDRERAEKAKAKKKKV